MHPETATLWILQPNRVPAAGGDRAAGSGIGLMPSPGVLMVRACDLLGR
jgi:hypothetical protein